MHINVIFSKVFRGVRNIFNASAVRLAKAKRGFVLWIINMYRKKEIERQDHIWQY